MQLDREVLTTVTQTAMTEYCIDPQRRRLLIGEERKPA
jgi:hypothetical protein